MKFVDVKLKCGFPGCESVGAEGEDVVITRILTLDRRAPREVDICKPHNDELFNGLIDALLADGRPVEGPAKKSASSIKKSKKPSTAAAEAEAELTAAGDDTDVYPDDVCRVVGDNDRICGRVAKNQTGLAQHVQRTHGYESLAAYYEVYPQPHA